MVGYMALNHVILVRIQASQQTEISPNGEFEVCLWGFR